MTVESAKAKICGVLFIFRAMLVLKSPDAPCCLPSGAKPTMHLLGSRVDDRNAVSQFQMAKPSSGGTECSEPRKTAHDTVNDEQGLQKKCTCQRWQWQRMNA